MLEQRIEHLGDRPIGNQRVEVMDKPYYRPSCIQGQTMKRLKQLRWTINRWIQVNKGSYGRHRYSGLDRAFKHIKHVEHLIANHNTQSCYTRNQLMELNRLYKQYKLSDEYSSPTAYASEY